MGSFEARFSCPKGFFSYPCTPIFSPILRIKRCKIGENAKAKNRLFVKSCGGMIRLMSYGTCPNAEIASTFWISFFISHFATYIFHHSSIYISSLIFTFLIHPSLALKKSDLI